MMNKEVASALHLLEQYNEAVEKERKADVKLAQCRYIFEDAEATYDETRSKRVELAIALRKAVSDLEENSAVQKLAHLASPADEP